MLSQTTSQNPSQDLLSHLHHPQPQHIPLQLKAGQCHVVWKPEQRGDTIGKTPYNAHAPIQSHIYYKASATNPRSWATFSQAMRAYEQNKDMGGIGRVLTDGILLIDLDHSVNRVTGEVHPAALEIMEMFDTNRELSPGDGVHIFPLARLPQGTKNVYFYKGIKVELYDGGRYTTITGIPVPGLPSILALKDQQAQLNALVELLKSGEHENTGVCVCVTARLGAQQNSGQGEQHRTCQTQSYAVAQQSEARTSTKRHEGVRKNEHQALAAATIKEEGLPPGDQLVLEKARAARNQETFRELWNGGDPHANRRKDKSQSAADFELILLLLYWTGDSATNDT